MNHKVYAIPGGVHPPQNKRQSLQSPLRSAGIPAQLVLPLSQHIGAPSKVCVEVGQQVLKGQVIAEASGAVSVALHAPTSGTVSAIEQRAIAHSSGMSAVCIVIDCDGADTWIEHQGCDNWQEQPAAELINSIRQAGIAGMGGAGFPSAIKLASDKVIDTLVINGIECEPYITADDMLMRERATQIVEGIKILQHILQHPSQTLVGIEDNKPEAIAAMQEAADASISIVVVPTKYPSGGEKQLIQLLTGLEVPSGGLPADVGIVCQNVGTCAAVADAIVRGRPLISRVTTLTGTALDNPGNVEVLLGTPVDHLLAVGGLNQPTLQRLIIGGPMMGFTLQDSAAPVVKTTNCILAASRDELPAPPPAQACIRCGMCAEACPASLLPQQLYWFARASELDKLENFNLADCIECGACSFVCPSHIPLVQYFRAGKAEVRQAKQDQAKSDHAKQRFEARQARLERLEQEKAEQRAARAAAAKARAEEEAKASAEPTSTESTNAEDPIQAAIARAQQKRAKANAPASAPTEPAASNADPVQAAIERAKAKREAQAAAGPETPQQKLQKLQKRMATAQQKLDMARADNSDKLAAFEHSVNSLQEKISQLEAEIAAQESN